MTRDRIVIRIIVIVIALWLGSLIGRHMNRIPQVTVFPQHDAVVER